MAAKIPATVVTGFLGAGKTSLIRHLLATAGGRGPDSRRLALIINEFGDLGVDGEILKACGIAGCDEDDVLELANGCICCTVADDFVPTMEALLARAEPPDHIVIETSGLALPKPLVKAFNWPQIRTRVTVDGVIAVVDGPAAAAGQFAAEPAAATAAATATDADTVTSSAAGAAPSGHDNPLEELFEEQLGCADLVIVNKADQMDERARVRAAAAVARELRPGVRQIFARHAAVDAAVLLGLHAAAESDLATRPSHHDEVDGEHDHDDFVSFVVEMPELDDTAALLQRLRRLPLQQPVLRVKGFAAVAGKPMRLLIQGVGDRLQQYFDRPWRDDETRVTRLVVIGEAGLDQHAVRAAITG